MRAAATAAFPRGGLIRDSAGNFYGTTYGVGANSLGTVYKIAPDGTATTLHSFAGGTDGKYPVAGLTLDTAGNLYGTTTQGGASCAGNGCGTVFKLAPDGTETVLYAFTNANDGGYPNDSGHLVIDGKGNLYGTAGTGGANNDGVIFEIAPDGTETVLYSFTGASDGSFPLGGLIKAQGNLYGTTALGGTGGGALFELGK
ncbi:MAG: choice-of-anchor tandem repeat GloVer-containing protein [Rhodospirillales bacterium]